MKSRFLFLLLFVGMTAYPQKPKLSENFTVQVGEEYGETVGGIKKYFTYDKYVIKFANHNRYDLVIQKLDPASLKEIDRIEKTDFFKKIEKGKLIGVEEFGDNLVLFYRLWNKKTKTTFFKIRTIALDNLEVSDFKIVSTQDGEVSGRSFFYETSLDEKKLLVLCKLRPKKSKDSKKVDRFSINVFDANFNELRTNTISMPYMNTMVMNVDYSIDNEGSFYVLTRVYKDEKSKKKKPFLNPDCHIELLELQMGSDEFIKRKIDVEEGYFINQVSIGQLPNGGVMVTGNLGKLFDVKKKQEILAPIGIFIASSISDNSAIEIKKYEFSDAILKKYKEDRRISKKHISKHGPYFKDFKITNVVYHDDGSMLLLGEQGSWSSRNVSSASIGYTHTSVSIKFDDIFIAKILADGTLDWAHRLPKQQRVDNRGASEMSFKYVTLNNKHYLFYQDHIANLDLEEDQFPGPLWDLTTGYLMAYMIDNTSGNVEKEAVFNLVDVNNGKKLEHFISNNILKISESEILIEGFEGRSKNFLVKVTAKK